MNALSIVLAGTSAGDGLRETARAALIAASACGLQTELIVPVALAEEAAVRKLLRDISCRILPTDAESYAARNNRGAEKASGDVLFFLREDVMLTAQGLQKLLCAVMNEEIAAVGPLSNRTIFAWQYINAEHMAAAEGIDASAWVETYLVSPTESLFLEDFALLVKTSAFRAVGGFDEAFAEGGADLDLSFRFKYSGYHLLRVPVYFPNAAAEVYDLYDLTRTAARPLLLERWGLDIGVPETILQESFEGIGWMQNKPLVRATARSALLRTPLVSILIPTYNRPEYFEDTLLSALSQTYPNIEIIVCDNSTDDRTEELMRAYQEDTRVRYMRNKEARTKAENFMPFEHLAQGEYLQWCMDDDILLPDKITRMVDAFLSEPTVTLVSSARGVIDGSGAFQGMWKPQIPLHGAYEKITGADVGRLMLMNFANFVGEPSAVLFRRRDLLHHYWQAESRGYKTISDCAMWLELLERGDAVMFSSPLSLYRQHSRQEGVQPDTVVLSRIEWRSLIEEYWHRHIFLSEEDYRRVLERLEEDHRACIEPLLPRVSPALRRTYERSGGRLHILMLNRVETCAPIRLDIPLGHLAARGDIAVSGCTYRDAASLSILALSDLRDSIIMFQRSRIKRAAQAADVLAAHAANGNILLQEMDDHPLISEQIVAENYFAFRAVSAVQTSTKTLADFLRTLNPFVYLFENQLPELPERRTYDAAQRQVSIFFGALNRRPDWESLMPALNKVIRRYGDRLRFHVVSDYAFYQALQTEEKVFVGGARDDDNAAPYDRYTAAIHASDIALLPLNDTAFNRAKSDLKFIESAGHGATVLASPTVYAATVRDGETGMIYRSPKEFVQKLTRLIEDARLRISIAENAYRYVAEYRLLTGHLDDYIAAYREMFARREEFERERLRRVAEHFPHL